MIPLIIIEGPTASGKSNLAVELAQLFNTEIISADSRQVYKYLDIGTAKPDKTTLQLLKHHLIDLIEPNQSFNAGIFCTKAYEIIRLMYDKGKIPIICGGTGLYIKSLLDGLFLCPKIDKNIRTELQKELKQKGLEHLYKLLNEIDPKSARNISEHDKQRVIRALEVFQSTGVPISKHWENQKKSQQYKPFRILVNEDRTILYQRIDSRILNMIEGGLIDEIRNIFKLGYTWDATGLNSVGYKEFKKYIDGTKKLEECIDLAQQHTRNYAKRQYTWYRKYTFHLTQPYLSINLISVREAISRYFDNKKSGELDGSCC